MTPDCRYVDRSGCKGTTNCGGKQKKKRKNLVFAQKSANFAADLRENLFFRSFLGDGVMVTLQVLVLSFPVRIRVAQQKRYPFIAYCYETPAVQVADSAFEGFLRHLESITYEFGRRVVAKVAVPSIFIEVA